MKLLKVHVPNYRSLKNVTLTFEPDLTPQVFPIGGENGGGKSTLLQLIFVLLHCSAMPERHEYITNTIRHMKRPDENWELRRYDIATIEILYQNEKLEFNFFLIPLSEEFSTEKTVGTITVRNLFNCFDIQTIEKGFPKTTNFIKTSFEKTKYPDFLIFSHTNIKIDEQNKDINVCYQNKREEETQKNLKKIFIDEFNMNIINLIELSTDKQKSCFFGFFYKSNLANIQETAERLDEMSNRIYLAGQPLQPYIFLNDNDIQELFSIEGKYFEILKNARKELPNFYTYDQFALLAILEGFKKARDKDFEKVIETGTYGTNYHSLLNELKSIIGGQKIIYPTTDLKSISVRYQTEDGNFIELGPGDLSHGELKRASLYAWIKYREINDAIVLIDEIENGLHPDWQYQMVHDLACWGNNQYLLATHSFYLCEALTPRHVKEIEPRMKNPVPEK